MNRSHSMLMIAMAALVFLAPQGTAQQSDDLDSVLRAWQKTTREVKSASCVLKRDTVDRALQSKMTETGFAMFLRARGPDDLARFRCELTNPGDPNAAQKFISVGNELYAYEPSRKVLQVFDLAKFKTTVLDNIGLLSFIFDLDVEQAKARYQMELVTPKSPDKHYHYIRVQPKRDLDKRFSFTEARISVNRASGLPAQIWYHEPNGKEITWNFTDLKIDPPNLPVSQFNPVMPAGWKMVRAR